MLHQLTARALIRDWTEGSLDSNRMEHEVCSLMLGGTLLYAIRIAADVSNILLREILSSL